MKVTVVVPVYKVSRYIEKCARSLFEQTLDELEILFVDDCSPDNSCTIIEKTLNEYPQRKKYTRIIHMPANSGQAGVRRQGIIEARGEYIIHCDGDDWVDTDLYEFMYNAASSNGSDICVCDYVEELESKKIYHPTLDSYSSPHNFLKHWYSLPIHMGCWNKMVKRTIYKENDILPWIGLNMWEDNGLMTRIYYHSHSVCFIHSKYYHYNRMNVNAMTAGYGSVQVEQMIKMAENLTDFFAESDDFKEYRNTTFAFQYLAKLNLITSSFKDYRRFKRIFPDSNIIAKDLSLNAFSRRGRIRFLMVKYNLAPLFILAFKLKKRICK